MITQRKTGFPADESILRGIHQALLIDDVRTTWAESSFSWIAHRLTQRFAIRRMPISGGGELSDLVASTVVVQNVAASPNAVNRILADGNATAVGSSFVYLPDFKQIIVAGAHSIDQEKGEPGSQEFAAYAILQLCDAESAASALAEMVGGEVASDLSKQSEPDSMLAVADDVFIPGGSVPSPFSSSPELQDVSDFFLDTNFASLTPDSTGVCVEVPFGQSETVLIQLLPNKPHPWLGNGLSVECFVPGADDEQTLVALAAHLQVLHLDAAEVPRRLGSWTIKEIHGERHLAWTCFVPNRLFRPGIVREIAISEVARAVWLDALFFPGLPKRSAWPLVNSRLKAKGVLGRGQLPTIPS